VLHVARAQIADDLVVAMLMHPDDKAGLQPGVVDNSKPAEACVIRLPQGNTWADSAELERALRSY
jgi:hypothetical protein